MPIKIPIRLRRLSQSEFGEISYSVMKVVFDMHNELGRFFDERIYKLELACRIPDVRLEVPIEVSHRSFHKTYYMDAMARAGALFEFKAAEALMARHRAQLLHYLLLAELGHGKLINVRPESVEHEFVNTTLTYAERTQFSVEASLWNNRIPGSNHFQEILTSLLRDWGTALELPLYEEALTHFLGGEPAVLKDVEVKVETRTVGFQRMQLAAPRVAFTLTSLDGKTSNYREHLHRLLSHTELDAIIWADLGPKHVTFATIH
ncbi:MAG: GxxExxY protein [Verrucomicrobiota bacterium]